jgi:hypothetical protein
MLANEEQVAHMETSRNSRACVLVYVFNVPWIAANILVVSLRELNAAVA